VLIVDDDRGIREPLRFAFEDAGYDVVEATDGIEAVDTLLLTPLRLVVLLDLQMPRMTGWDVLSLVAEYDELAVRHAIIVLTGNHLTDTNDALLQNYAIPVVPKPFDVDRLLTVVAQASNRLLVPASLVPLVCQSC
jgi:CheY-like chemotaxis protein